MQTDPSVSRRLAAIQELAAFRVALRRFERRTELAAQSAGLTPRQYILLLAAEGAPDGSGRATIGELADRLQLAQSTITGLVDRAEASGLVHREPGRYDGRVVVVGATAEGRRRLDEVIRGLDEERGAIAEAAAAVWPHLERPPGA